MLIRHFRLIHGLTVKAASSETFRCGQGACSRDFNLIYSLRRHILKCHYQLRENNDANEREQVVELEHMDEGPQVGGLRQEENNIPPAPPLDIPNTTAANNPQEFDLRLLCLNFIAQLRSQTNVTGENLATILSEIDSLLNDVTANMKSRVQNFLAAKNLLDDIASQNLLKSLELNAPFGDLKTLEKQIESFKNGFGYVEPKEYTLGTRLDSRFDKESCSFVQKQVYETCQYVPVIDVLKLLMSNEKFREVVQSENPNNKGLISSFVDGQHYRNNAFYHDCDLVLRLLLYYDELEIANPLGSKTGIHKIGAFYYTIQNLPDHLISSLENMHVLLLCYDEDRKKYGFRKVLTPFLNDLRKLETTGVSIQVGAEELKFKATVAGYSGDGLAVHEFFELLGPSANKFCRLCLISREDLHAGRFGIGPVRSREVFENHLALLRANVGNRHIMSETGMVGDCALNSSSNFHVTTNYIFDIMHDILEGIGPFELKLVLKQYICEEGLFTVAYFNHKVKTFYYGMIESKNKPSANFSLANLRNLGDHKIKQRAMQTWVLLRAFPFLVEGKVLTGDKYMNLILLLLGIMEVVYAPTLSPSILPYLDDMIKEHHNAFLSLFPTVNMINKHHHLSHYPQCILEFGPLRDYWCMRFEGKHNTLKRHAQVMCNFKNPPKTLIRICQFIQSNAYGSNRFKSVTGKTVLINDTLSREDMIDLGYPANKSVFSAVSLSRDGVVYRLGMTVALESNISRDDDNLPLFGKIVEIIVVNSEVFLKTKFLQA